MTISEKLALRVFIRKVLWKIYGSLHIGHGEYRSRWNEELYEINDDIDIELRDSGYAG